MPLTDVQCRNAKPDAKPIRMFDGGGLYLEVTPAGGKHWKQKYRNVAGKEKKLSIGSYPAIGLKDARIKRDEAKRLLYEGKDPCELKKEAKRKQLFDANNTFRAVAEDWIISKEDGWSENHLKTVKRRLEMDIFPKLGKRPIAHILAPEIVKTVKEIEERGAYETARRAIQYIRQIYDYAYCHAVVEKNPATHMTGILKTAPKSHFATINADELPALIKSLKHNEARMFPQTVLAFELMMHTFVRTSELIKTPWSEIDLDSDVWIIAADRMKGQKHHKKKHIVPLTPRTKEIFRELHRLNGHREFVFPSKTNPRNHMSNNTILSALRRMGYAGIMTGHGFRSLALTTIIEELGYPFEVPDAQLAHSKKGSVRKAYDRTQYLDQRKKMMSDWSNYLQKKGL